MVVVAAGCGMLAGCAGPEESGPPAARVTAWMSGAGGGAAVGALLVDSRNISYALSRRQAPAAIKTACALLTNDAETAIGNLPTPDTQLTDELNAAYEDAAAAGDACFQGASGKASLLRKSATERSKLGPLLTVAVDRIGAVTGHTPSTSTTEADGSCDDPFGGCN
ncbi:MAG TPA: hypothetical protein VHW93_07870 [Acidimicrobiales bacterium]|nr:hypothetical protein [Acidimicrobiales bacterium]